MRSCLIALLLAGCAYAPPVDKSGLPKVGRYTNTAQLDWMLGTYAQVAAQTGDPQVREDACLGWERAVFDIQSFQLYSVVLRMSTDAAGLQGMRDGLFPVIARHPLPAACGPVPTRAADPQDVQAAVEKTEEAPGAAAARGEPGESASESGQPQDFAKPGPPAAPPPVPAVTERQLLAELRRALRLRRDGSEAAYLAPEGRGVPPIGGAAGTVDEARLMELAKSAIPTVRLRARFHLLGRCQSVVEETDAYPTTARTCPGAAPGENPRHGIRRLRDQMLRAWSSRYTEPMSDIVIALANSTSRDNPLVDGPRVSR
jgi:hypothetical protein